MFHWDQILRWPLLPVLLGQAIQVKRRAIVLPEPDGRRMGQSGSGPELRLLILGDSAAAGVGVAHQSQALSGQLVAQLSQAFTVIWRLEATTGHTTQDTLSRLSTVDGPFDVVVTSLGVNDTTRGVRPFVFFQRQQTLFQRLTDEFNARVIIASAVPDMALFPALPTPLRFFVGAQSKRLGLALEQAVSTCPKARHIRPEFDPKPDLMAADGYHPSAKAYAIWAQALAQEICAYFPERI